MLKKLFTIVAVLLFGLELHAQCLATNDTEINGVALKSHEATMPLRQDAKTWDNAADSSNPSPVDAIVVSYCPKPDFFVTESNRWAVLDWMPGAATNQEVLVGFDLYRDDERIGHFWNDDMRLQYVDDAVELGKGYSYRLEAFYEDGCVAAMTDRIMLTGEGIAKKPFGFTYKKKVNDDFQNYDVTLTWETPMYEEPLALGYCNGLVAQPVNFDHFYECWGAIRWNETDLDPYRDLYLVGMEYVIGAAPKVYEVLVYLNGEQVYKQTVRRPVPGSWGTFIFDQSFPMDQPQEVVVGFHTKYSAEKSVLVVDPTVTKNGYSDIVSLDGLNWASLTAGGYTGSWLLRALVVHKRDLEAAENADGTVDYTKLEGRIMRVDNTDGKLSAKAPLQLLGFNVYRTDEYEDTEVKLNDTLLTSFTWIDSAVVPGDYDYEVGAVYADGKEVRTMVFVELVGCSTPQDFHVEDITADGADFISSHQPHDFLYDSLLYRIVYITPDDGGQSFTMIQDADVLRVRDSLTEATAYTATTQAVCKDIRSAMSEAIHFTTLSDTARQDSTSAVETIARLNALFSVRAQDGQVAIQNPNGLLIRNVSVHNLNGTKLADYCTDSRDDLLLPVNAKGLLVLVRLQTERGMVVYKIYLP